jgi:prostaglandin-H2 D-isomerase / glutathione transferase
LKFKVIVDQLIDFKQAYDAKVDGVPEEQRVINSKKFLVEDAPKHLDKIEELITMCGVGKVHVVGNALTWADLYIFDVMTNYQKVEPNLLSHFPHIEKIRLRVETNPRIASWIEKRPNTKF